jgi:hypothetical protein
MRSHSLNLLTANCLQQRFAIAPLQLPQTSFFNEPQRHRGHREREIAPPQPPKQRSHPLNSPNSDRTPLTPKQRSHPLNSQTAIASPELPKQRSHPSTPKQRSHPFNFPTSFFNEPQRHRGHREFRAKSQRSKDAKNHTPQLPNIFF